MTTGAMLEVKAQKEESNAQEAALDAAKAQAAAAAAQARAQAQPMQDNNDKQDHDDELESSD